ITLECFDVLRPDPVFQNQSNLPQMAVDAHLVIVLYHFGHYGNAISTTMVA
ncbi:hypothetical protein PAXRUDRAFT_71302, partial [Paxillus rubicundulus Ve08.2h10]